MGRSDAFYKRYGYFQRMTSSIQYGIGVEQKEREEEAHNVSPKKPQETETSIVEGDERLRDYQRKAVNDILNLWRNGNSGYNIHNVMLQMPTGTGKTRLFVALINALNATEASAFRLRHQPRFLIVTHRVELVEQISETLNNHYHLNHKILGRKEASPQPSPVGRETETTIFVSSIQYISRQLKNRWSRGVRNNDLTRFDFIIVDEAHHSLADSYLWLWDTYPDAFKLGVTATPYRLRGSSFTDLFEVLIKSQKISDFIEQGYLADYRFFTVSEKQTALQKVNRLTKVNIGGDYQTKDLQDIYANSEEIQYLYKCYEEHVKGKRGIIYAVNQLHAEMIATYFAEQGVSIANIDSKTESSKRKELIAHFRSGELQVLVNVELFGEGFDCPAIEFAMLARPTKSLAMYLQQVGRALRPMPSASEKLKVKSEKFDSRVIILDCVGLYNRFGLPERERNWDAHFRGSKIESENYSKKLGVDEDVDGMLEVNTPRIAPKKETVEDIRKKTQSVYCGSTGLYGIRNDLGKIIVSATYKELAMATGGWFYGRDTQKNLVVFDKAGTLVFKRKHCDIEILELGNFYIKMRAIDGVEFKIGPYRDNMYIEAKYHNKQRVSCGTDSFKDIYMDFYYLKDSTVIMTSPRLSLDTLFFRRQLPYTKTSYIFVDMENKAYGFNRGGIPTPATPLWSDSAERIAKGYKKL